jgi:hypothetical protein
MKLTNAIKKLEKVSENGVNKEGQIYSGVINGNVVSFSQNGREDSAVCFHIKAVGEKSDSMTDYFPGTFCNNLSQAIRLAAM